MKYLVIGASGQVGKALRNHLGAEAVGTGHRRVTGDLLRLDLADTKAVGRLIREIRPEGIFVPGGVTAVDWCETHEAEARRICVDGTVAVREAAEAIGAHVVFFSTDYVFSGISGPYGEDDPPDPISVYGRIKVEAERAAGDRFAILRTSMVYSDDPDSRNFHNFVRDTLRAGGEVKAFSDQSGSPTYAQSLVVSAVAMRGKWKGIHHVAGPEVLTRLEFAHRVARAYKLDESRIRPVTSEEMRLPAPRPKQGGLRSTRSDVLPTASLAEALAEMMKAGPR
ncbi:MAG TPA: SDR family oxidoreductase [Planctomycetota bacterium]|nr:SDR family oxidoreductase [Planctomycetota bacterium]